MTTMTDPAVRPSRVRVPDDDLAGPRRRITATRWPSGETVTDRSQGVQSSAIQNLVTYWGTGYHWRRCEAELNALPQFTAGIDGLVGRPLRACLLSDPATADAPAGRRTETGP